MRLYLAGPMAGLPDANYPAFDAAAERLTELGHQPVSLTRDLIRQSKWHPSRERFLAECPDAHARIMKNDLAHLLTCEGIVLLEGWKVSKGATLEALVARAAGLRFFVFYPASASHPTLVDVTYMARVEDLAQQYAVVHGVNWLHAAQLVVVDEPPYVKKTVLDEANSLINGNRQEAYGHPLENFTDIADLWTAYLRVKAYDFQKAEADTEAPTDSLAAEDVAMMQALLKIAREAKHPKRDNQVDGAGYLGCLELIHAKRKEQNV